MELTVWAAFIAGLLSFVSPCVLPLVPPYLGFLGGASIDELQGRQMVDSSLRLRLLMVSVTFVLGFSTVFIALGATASVVGQLLARYSLQLAFIAGLAILVMGLHFLGLFRLSLLYREARFQGGVKAGPLGAYVMGLAFAFGWTPCIGPVLATILAIAGTRSTLGQGAALLGIYAAGLGVPFLLAGLFAPTVLGWMARFRRHMHWVERAMGVLLVVTGVLFMTGGMTTISAALLEMFPGLAQIG